MALLRRVLYPKEEVRMVVKQHRVSSLAPMRLIATDRRVILIRPSFWGLHFGYNILSPTQITILPYKNIISVGLLNGLMLSTVHIRMQGFSRTEKFEDENEIPGIPSAEASNFTSLVEEIIEDYPESEEEKAAGRKAKPHRASVQEPEEPAIRHIYW